MIRKPRSLQQNLILNFQKSTYFKILSQDLHFSFETKGFDLPIEDNPCGLQIHESLSSASNVQSNNLFDDSGDTTNNKTILYNKNIGNIYQSSKDAIPADIDKRNIIKRKKINNGNVW